MSCRCFLPGPILNRIGPEQSKDNWNLIICQLRQNKSIPDQVQNQFWNCSIEDQTIFRKKSKKTAKPSSVSKKYFEHCGQKINFLRNNFFLSWGIFSWSRYRLFFEALVAENVWSSSLFLRLKSYPLLSRWNKFSFKWNKKATPNN